MGHTLKRDSMYNITHRIQTCITQNVLHKVICVRICTEGDQIAQSLDTCISMQTGR